jgi:hypothetical protein
MAGATRASALTFAPFNVAARFGSPLVKNQEDFEQDGFDRDGFDRDGFENPHARQSMQNSFHPATMTRKTGALSLENPTFLRKMGIQ